MALPQKIWTWFLGLFPAAQQGNIGIAQAYAEVMQKHSVVLRRAANDTLIDYLGVVLNEINARLLADLSKGEVPGDYLKGALGVLEELVSILYQLAHEHDKEQNLQGGSDGNDREG